MKERSGAYFAAGRAVEAEADRLRRLDAFYAGPTRDWLTRNTALAQGSRVVEFGAGSGGMLDWFADKVGPHGDVLGVDLNLDHVAPPAAPIRHLKADILGSPVEPGLFDLAFARLVLMHVADPGKALARMAQWVKPGGRVAVADLDCSTARPIDLSQPGMAECLESMEALRRKLRASGLMDPDFGGRLPDLFSRAGLTDITVETVEGEIEGGSQWACFMAESNLVAGEALGEIDICQTVSNAFLTPGLRFHDQALVCVTGRTPV